jgi:hypothetical protein
VPANRVSFQSSIVYVESRRKRTGHLPKSATIASSLFAIRNELRKPQ